ncbi:DUF805 domain-containing protein [Pseudidiomarina sp. 1APP75-32.1]|uniref:DUF805 domain-containing protein n=1 Tax=Pseudidiomarina terrestris TaxID=2820060 RepID=A0AAW7QYG0_9GAMM|nr:MULTISPECIES: DUF805 domain-containing protein [unclassified Pseudidiomarina]MDN7123900.1 DUF805 domain-containing protein [Pseudidiomarina sp. 1APP75-32.1]MDN7138760.1 DUF805 domain-containing protein [Pseudidiomarina sp. 1ASP75-14]
MKIDTAKILQLRQFRGWSQQQLADIAGITLRTVQRIEASGAASLESIQALAAAFEVPISELADERKAQTSEAMPQAVSQQKPDWRDRLIQLIDFSGTLNRADYWRFFLISAVSLGLATLVHPILAEALGLLVVVPLIAFGSRRLRDVGVSGWWQLLALVPFGGLVVLFLLALPRGYYQKATTQQ